MASTYLQRTLGTPTSSRIWTFSAWVKRSGLGSTQHIFSIDSGSNRDAFSFDSDNGLRLYFNGSATGYADLSTDRVLRDTSTFYHLVIAVDTTQGTAADRVKLYINGTQYTWDETTVYGDQNYDTFNANGNTFRIGRDRTDANYFDGLMSHVHFCDGTQLAPTVFGSTDSTTGEWKINTSPSFTPGNNGFTVLKDGSTITDQSANSNDFSLGGGTLTQTEDCPSNVFATWNNLANRETATNGATQINPSGDASYTYSVSTLGASTGKYYFEFESNGGNGRALIGMVESDYASKQIKDNEEPGANAHSFAYRQNQGDIQINSSTSSYGTQITWGTSANVLMMAVDLDNNKVWYGVDGTWQNSGDPSNGTNGFDWSAVRTAGKHYLVLAGDDTSSGYGNIQANFGNGVFGSTAISSEGTNASNIGKFEYNVPTGFTALSTKGLNE